MKRDLGLLSLTLTLLAWLFVSSAAAQDMPLSQLLLPGEDWQLVGEGYEFTEAPAVDAEGNFYFADVPKSKIYKVTGDGKPEVYIDDSGRTCGMMFGSDGRLYCCQSGTRKIVAYDAEKKAHVIAAEVDGNDLVVTRAGGIYFTDPAKQQVWYIDPQGEKRVVDKGGFGFANGIIMWPDQGTLIVADTRGPNLATYRIEADGSLAFRQPYSTLATPLLSIESGADGMTTDKAGRIYIATHLGVQVLDTQGRLSGIMHKPQQKFLSNLVFAGTKLDTLYATCTDKVFRRKLNTTGIRFSDQPAAK